MKVDILLDRKKDGDWTAEIVCKEFHTPLHSASGFPNPWIAEAIALGLIHYQGWQFAGRFYQPDEEHYELGPLDFRLVTERHDWSKDGVGFHLPRGSLRALLGL